MSDKKNGIDLTTHVGGITLKSPVMTASGTFGYGKEFDLLLDLDRLGGIIVKGLSLKAEKGNPPPRIVETPCGMLNAIGLENIGIDRFQSEKLPFLKKISTPIIVNIYGKTIDDYAELSKRIETIDGISGIEINISCPNVKAGGIAFGTDPQAAHDVVQAVKNNTEKTVIVKLSPNVTDIVGIALKAEEAGADALSLINTITGMAVDIETGRPKLANVTGGLSGPAIKPVALRMVWQVFQNVNIPVIGIGGILTAMDALEFIITGAAAVQVGTANFVNPRATIDIINGVEDYLRKKNIEKVTDIIGTLKI